MAKTEDRVTRGAEHRRSSMDVAQTVTVRLMIVDDDDRWTEALEAFVKRCGSMRHLEVVVLRERRGNRVLFQAKRFRPDAIVLDSYLKNSDGFWGEELAGSIRECSELANSVILRVDEEPCKVKECPALSVFLDRFDVPVYLCEYLKSACPHKSNDRMHEIKDELPDCAVCERYGKGNGGRVWNRVGVLPDAAAANRRKLEGQLEPVTF